MAGPHGPTYRFGPFTLDAARRVLMHGDARVWLTPRQMNVLLYLVEHAGQVVTKDDLVAAAWEGAAVGDNSGVQAVAKIREALATHSPGVTYIETVPREGYRFSAGVEQGASDAPAADLKAMRLPFTALTESRDAIESLRLDAIERAGQSLENVPVNGRFDGLIIALASALFFRFESRRVDENAPTELLGKVEWLTQALCFVKPGSFRAWAMLGVVKFRRGNRREGLADVRRAIDLAPDRWLPYFAMAYISAGEERVDAATEVLALCPGFAFAHYFAATVFVARGVLDSALRHARLGCGSQDSPKPGRFPAVGLHWLAGAILDAMGMEAEALAEFARELEFEHLKHVYSRESCANAWYWIGAIHLRNGRDDEASRAFEEVLRRVPTHRRALAALKRDAPIPAVVVATTGATVTDVGDVIDTAVVLAIAGNHEEAARMTQMALEGAEPGAEGWQLPLEPILRPLTRPDLWAPALALLRERAR